MSIAQQSVFSAPFDSVASCYDETFTSSLIGRAQRAAVWKELEKTFHSGQRILEIGCGTGVDACFLAERSIQVVACDSSSEMIAVTRQKVREKKLEAFVEPVLLRAEDLSSFRLSEQFDGAFSNFGVLNCVENCSRLGDDLARLLKPHAIALLCWMGPCCLWEMIWYLAHGDRGKAFRRLGRDGVRTKIAEGAFLQVRYPSANSLARELRRGFRLKSIKGVGAVVPPSYVEPWARRHPKLLELCARLDSVIARWPGIRALGDHVLVRLQRESSAGEP